MTDRDAAHRIVSVHERRRRQIQVALWLRAQGLDATEAIRTARDIDRLYTDPTICKRCLRPEGDHYHIGDGCPDDSGNTYQPKGAA